MPLRCEQLEPRTPAVALQWVFAADPWLAARESTIRSAGDWLASRLTPTSPLAPIDTPFAPLDLDGSPLPAASGPLPADTLRVYVGGGAPAGTLAVAAPGGYTAAAALPRPWGGVIRFDTGRPWEESYSLPWTTAHEIGHVFGAGHTDDPAGLMYPFARPVGTALTLTPIDVAEFARVGWSAALPATPTPTPPPLDGWVPFPSFSGPVSLTSADLTADGVPDLVAAAGAGGGPHVRVRDGATGGELASFFAFDPAFAGGVSMAVGDVTGDGTPDVVVGAGPGGGPHVKAFDGRTMDEVRSFFAGEPTFSGGVSVAVSGGQILTAAGGEVRGW